MPENWEHNNWHGCVRDSQFGAPCRLVQIKLSGPVGPRLSDFPVRLEDLVAVSSRGQSCALPGAATLSSGAWQPSTVAVSGVLNASSHECISDDDRCSCDDGNSPIARSGFSGQPGWQSLDRSFAEKCPFTQDGVGQSILYERNCDRIFFTSPALE